MAPVDVLRGTPGSFCVPFASAMVLDLLIGVCALCSSPCCAIVLVLAPERRSCSTEALRNNNNARVVKTCPLKPSRS